MAELLRMSFNAQAAARQLNLLTKKQQAAFRLATRKSLEEAAVLIRRRVTPDIQRAGAFSARWSAAFVINTTMRGWGASQTTGFSKAIPYAHVHEFGATIRGRPLLWIPLPWNPFKRRAREFPGKLFRVNRPGKNPLLFSAADKQAKYVGVTHVTLRPRFHIRSIVANVIRTTLAKLFAKYVSGVKLTK